MDLFTDVTPKFRFSHSNQKNINRQFVSSVSDLLNEYKLIVVRVYRCYNKHISQIKIYIPEKKWVSCVI